MLAQILPASAAAFAPRASKVNVILGSNLDPWLTQLLKRVNRVKRPLNNVSQQEKWLTDILSPPEALWTLASIIVPTVPDTHFHMNAISLAESTYYSQVITIEAYIVHIDMVMDKEIVFKLTTETIDSLNAYHDKVHCVNLKARTLDWAGKEQQCQALHEEFVQAINAFIYRAPLKALEGLEENGTGELLCGKSQEVSKSIKALMKCLIPPQSMVEPARFPPVLPSSPMPPMNWSQANWIQSLPAPVAPWEVLTSSPTGTCLSVDSSNDSYWTTPVMSQCQLTPPPPAFSYPLSQQMPRHMVPQAMISQAMITQPTVSHAMIPQALITQPSLSQPATYYGQPIMAAGYHSTSLPSMLAPQGEVTLSYEEPTWDRYHEYTSMF